ncbi:MAG: hypothetical protein K6U79_03810 [Firmicutes bacterium]|nr:hypothetical protein [Bacillota bacterium]
MEKGADARVGGETVPSGPLLAALLAALAAAEAEEKERLAAAPAAATAGGAPVAEAPPAAWRLAARLAATRAGERWMLMRGGRGR